MSRMFLRNAPVLPYFSATITDLLTLMLRSNFGSFCENCSKAQIISLRLLDKIFVFGISRWEVASSLSEGDTCKSVTLLRPS